MFINLKRLRYGVQNIRLVMRFTRSFYDSYFRHDTIFAPATHVQSAKGSPLGVIRVSGEKAKDVLELLTNHKVAQEALSTNCSRVIKPRHVKLVKFRNPFNKELIDQGLVLWFEGPNSYTGENVCEFHLHGSRSVMSTILRILGQLENLRSAEPGEFTRRAYLNGKLSLIQAESLKDLIESRTDHQRKLALSGLSGSTLEKYQSWSDLLVRTLAHLEASIDFGEDSSLNEHQMRLKCTDQIHLLIQDLSTFTDISSRRRQAVQDGFKVVILGEPNSGKSTLMNLLCGHDKSIVSSLSGTTRDVVEHSIELEGHLLVLSDTAGLKDFESLESKSVEGSEEDQLLGMHELVEKEGIKRALHEARRADMVLFMVDGSKIQNIETEKTMLVAQVKRVLDMSCNKMTIPVKLIVNKIDNNNHLKLSQSLESLRNCQELCRMKIKPYMISCQTRENVDSLLHGLTEQLDKMALLDNEDTSRDLIHYVNDRHLNLLKATLRHLQKASELEPTTAIDRIAQHLRESVGYLSCITGGMTNERVIDIIFKDFCIGK